MRWVCEAGARGAAGWAVGGDGEGEAGRVPACTPSLPGHQMSSLSCPSRMRVGSEAAGRSVFHRHYGIVICGGAWGVHVAVRWLQCGSERRELELELELARPGNTSDVGTSVTSRGHPRSEVIRGRGGGQRPEVRLCPCGSSVMVMRDGDGSACGLECLALASVERPSVE